MKRTIIGKIAGLMAVLAIGIGGSTSANAAYYWQNITGNNTEDLSGQLSMVVSGSGSSLVLTFYNNVGIASSICDIYIDAPPPGEGDSPSPYFLSSTVTSSAGVSFGTPASPNNLPGGSGFTPDFAASIGFDSESPGITANGVNATGEWVKLELTLNGPTTVADVIAALEAGQFRVGMHIQAIGANGDSDSYLTVPEPTTMIAGALLLLPFGASTIRFIRKNRAA